MRLFAGPGDAARRPGGTRGGARRVDALVGVHRRVEEGAERIGIVQDAAQGLVGGLRETELALGIAEQIGLAGLVPEGDMGVAAIAGEVREGLRHEGRAHAVLLGDRLRHVFEEDVAIGGQQSVVIFPVHLELAVRVLVVVLIGLPAEFQHAVADLGDDVVAPHQRLLVVAGLVLGVGGVGDGFAVWGDQEVFAFDAALHAEALLVGLGDLALQEGARAVGDDLAVHPEVAGQPAHFRFPRQLDEAVGIGAWRRGRDEPASCRARSRSRRNRRRRAACRQSPGPAPAWRAMRPNRSTYEIRKYLIFFSFAIFARSVAMVPSCFSAPRH